MTTLTNDISRVNPGFTFGHVTLGSAPINELRSIAEKLKYDPNTNDYHQSIVSTFKADGVDSRIVVSFHSVGSGFRGLVVAVGYFQAVMVPRFPFAKTCSE